MIIIYNQVNKVHIESQAATTHQTTGTTAVRASTPYNSTSIWVFINYSYMTQSKKAYLGHLSVSYMHAIDEQL